MNVRYNYGVSVIVLRGVWAGCSPFLWSLRSQVDIPQRMWCMASATPKLRLPSRPQST